MFQQALNVGAQAAAAFSHPPTHNFIPAEHHFHGPYIPQHHGQ